MNKIKTPKKIILIGAGGRGMTYTDQMYSIEGEFQVVAIAEPVKDRREYVQKKWNVPDEMCFDSWEALLDMPKFADAAVIATMDRDHFKPAMKAIEQGYHLLLEKPMSSVPDECAILADAAEKKGVIVLVCHVLRYTVFFRALKNVIDSGRLGDIIHIDHTECVGNVHQSHSFVRGNWGDSDESSPMILQKSCHDMDILQWLLGKKCERVQSFGSLTYFRKENAPEGSPEYCVEGCPIGDTCPYNAVKLYYDDKNNSWFRGASTKKINPTDEDMDYVIRNTQYGKCVFKCNNNVVDHQAVNLEFEGGTTVSFTLCAFNRGGRFIRVMGTKGEIYAKFGAKELELYNFETSSCEKISVSDVVQEQSILGGHGGGDTGIVHAFLHALNGDTSEICSISETCSNHLIAFAAEESRLNGNIIDFASFEKGYEVK